MAPDYVVVFWAERDASTSSSSSPAASETFMNLCSDSSSDVQTQRLLQTVKESFGFAWKILTFHDLPDKLAAFSCSETQTVESLRRWRRRVKVLAVAPTDGRLSRRSIMNAWASVFSAEVGGQRSGRVE